LFAILAGAAVASASHRLKESRFYLIFIGLALIIFIGLRKEVGADWWNYLSIYKVISHGSLGHALKSIEPSYGLINWFAAQQGWGIWFPNLVCATLFTIGLVALCRQQPNTWLALAVSSYIIVLVAMGYTRQSAALGMGMLAMAQYSRGATLRVAISIAIAVSFHTSAIIFAPIFALASARRGVGTMLMISLLGAVLLYELYGSVTFLIERYSEQTFTATGAVPRLMLNLIPAMLFLAFRKRFARNDAELRFWTLMSLLACLSVLLLVFFNSSLIADRLGLYLSPIQIFVLSRVPTAFSGNKPASLVPVGLLLAYSLITEVVWLSYATWAPYWLPYGNYLIHSDVHRVPPRWFRYVR